MSYAETLANSQGCRLVAIPYEISNVILSVSLVINEAKEDRFDNPNIRGNAVFLLCKFYLERRSH